MANATTLIEYFGAAASEPAGVSAEDTTGLIFNLEDSKAGVATPLHIPFAAGTRFSWYKQMAVNVTVAGTTAITNRSVQLATALATGLGLFFKGASSYVQAAVGNKPADDAANNGVTPAGYTLLTTSPQVFHAGSVSTAGTGRNGNFCLLVAAVDQTYVGGPSAAGTGNLPDLTFTFTEA